MSINSNLDEHEMQNALPTNSNDLGDSKTQDALTSNLPSWTTEQNIDTMLEGATCCMETPTVAILADYDGCWDVISETNPKASEEVFQAYGADYPFVKGILESAVASIAHEKKVTLFVGSNRQSSLVDNLNSARNQNGLALGENGFFEKLAEKNKTKGWSLNKALLSDGDMPFSSWGNNIAFSWSGKDQDLKVRIAENSFKHLNCAGKTDVFFFDDKSNFLEHVRKNAKIPEHVNFYTVHYDWYSYALEGNKKPLVAKSVDGKEWKL